MAQTSETAQEFLTEKDFCRRYRVSREAAHRLRLDPLDPLPNMRFGRRVLYSAAAVERWAERRAERKRKEAAR